MRHYTLTFSFILMTVLTFAQRSINDRVSFVADNLSLSEALISLSMKSKINIAFSNSILPPDVRVNIIAKEKPFKIILKEVLDGTNLSFKMFSDQVILFRDNTQKVESISINGYIEDADTGEKLVGANVYNPNNAYGTDSNEYGYFNFYGVPNMDSIFISYLGYETQKFLITKDQSQNLVIRLRPTFFETVVVTADNQTEDFIKRPKSGVDRLDLSKLQNIISIGGEPDIFQAAYQLGGINTGADGVGGLHVRGGNLDQNLILLDGAPIYRPEHAIGILSVFNSDALRSAKIYKGNFPSKYGGRLSSVLDIQTKEGNNQEYSGKVSVGLLTAKASLEGPIIKDKASFFISYRRALTDLYVPEITERLAARDSVSGFSNYVFYDFNAKANIKLSKSDRLYFSYYEGRDDFTNSRTQPTFRDSFQNIDGEILAGTFQEGNQEELSWGNRMASLRWNHIFGDRIFANTTAYNTNYDFFSSEEFRSEGIYDNGRNDLIAVEGQFSSRVNDQGIRTDVEFLQSDRLNFKFGGGLIKHRLSPGSSQSVANLIDIPTFQVADSLISLRDSLELFEINTTESFAYYETGVSLNRQLYLTLGLHARHWKVGENAGENVDDYQHLSVLPRISLDYQMNDAISFSASFLEMVQYMHLLTKADIGLPGDIWVPATENVAPEGAKHVQIGTQIDLKKGWALSATAYYKEFENLVEFLGGDSTLVINALNYESNVTQGVGVSKGIEFSASKTGDKFNANLNYTLSKTDRQFDALNEGRPFPYRFDLRHMLNIGGVYHINKKWSANFNWIYNSGINLTIPIAQYGVPSPFSNVEPTQTTIFSERNGQRLTANQRLDLGVNYHHEGKRFKHKLAMGIYNVYNHTNPIYYRVRRNPEDRSEFQFVSVSLLPITPSLSYSVSF